MPSTSSPSLRPPGRRTRRRAVLAGVVVAAAVLATAASAGAKPPLDLWSDSSGGDVGNSGFNSVSKVKADLVPAYSLAARAPFGGCAGGRVSKPVATSERLFYSDGMSVRAARLSDGGTVWSSPLSTYGTERVWDLSVSGNTVVAAGSSNCTRGSNTDPFMRAYDATTGAVLWDAELYVSSTLNFGPAIDTLTIADTMAVISGADPIDRNKVAGVDLATGVIRWMAECSPASSVGFGTMVLDCDDWGYLAVSTKDGTTRWVPTVPTTFPVADGATIPNGRNFYGQDPVGRTMAVDVNTGVLRWTSAQVGAPVAATTTLVLTRCATSSLCALNRSTGALVWRNDNASPTSANARVTVADRMVWPYQLQLDTGVRKRRLVNLPDLQQTMGFAGGYVFTSDSRVIDVYRPGGF